MPANINTYIGRASAWHNLGTVTGHYMSWKEILEIGGLDFDVFKSQLRDGLGRPVDAWGVFRWNRADKLAGRKDAAEYLGVVGEGYTPINHTKGFEMIDALVASKDAAHYETAGVLGKGEVVWGLADLRLSVSVGSDKSEVYLLFSTSHDGSMAHTYRTCVTRVVCQNTLNMALGEKTRAVFRVRHTVNAEQRLSDAHKALEAMGQDVRSIEDKLNFLAGRKMTREATTSILDRLFPKQKTDEGQERETTRRENILGDILKLYELNDGNAFPEQRGTAYNMLNAVTNYVDHERSARNDGRAASAMFGSGDALKSKALEVITLTANGLPMRQTQVVSIPAKSASILDTIAEEQRYATA